MASNGALRDSINEGEPKLALRRRVTHICSFCEKCFPSLQALGGHQTVHRREIKEMREEHEKFMEQRRKRAKDELMRHRALAAPVATGKLRRVHVGGGSLGVLVEYDFLGVFDGVDGPSPERSVADPAIKEAEGAEKGDEATSSEELNLELSF